MEKSKKSVHLLAEFMKDKKSIMLLSMLIALIGELIGLFPFYAISKIIVKTYTGLLEKEYLISMIVLSLLAYIVRYILTWCSTMLSHKTAFGVLRKIRDAVVDKMMRVSMGEVLSRPIGEWKNILIDQVSALEDSIAHILPEITACLFAPLAAIVYLFCINWKMGLISLVTIPLGMLCYMGVMPNYHKKLKRYTAASNEMNTNLVEYVNGIEVVKAFAKRGNSYEKYSASVKLFHDTTMEWWQSSWFFNSLAKSILPSTLLGTLPLGTYMLMQGELQLDAFILSIVLPLSFIGPLLKITAFFDEFGFIDSSLKELGKFLYSDDMEYGNKDITDKNEGFKFDKVSFSYEDELVLKDVCFEAKQGETTAIVGPSGSGKSTIAKLMAGFWQTEKGMVSYGGQELKKLDYDNLISQISYVAQDNFLFNQSILDNLMIANKNASMQEITEACKIANCHDLIMSLPHGYTTNVGDAGGMLSGGERQRITLARAILKDAPVIILDEATAYADPETDYLIQEAINKMIKGKTMIVVAHRLSTIVNADQILVVEKGRLLDSGKHHDLLSSCSLYNNMWNQYQNIQKGAC